MEEKPHRTKTVHFNGSSSNSQHSTNSVKSFIRPVKSSKQNLCLNVFKLAIAALPTIVFGVFTVIFTLQQDRVARSTREQDQRQADETNRRILFKEYIDDMKELLLDEHFDKNINKSLLQIRIQTLTVLRHLDSTRKRDVLRFLYESRLIRGDQSIFVDLHGANLNGIQFEQSSIEECDFRHLYLPGVYAENVVFRGCILAWAVFANASMAGSKFHLCYLGDSNFVNANLTQVEFHDNQLYRTSFTGASLTESSIEGGIFQDVDLTNVDLYQSDISDQLLYPMNYGGMAPNVLLNARLPSGSFNEIISGDLILHGQIEVECHRNTTPFWRDVISDEEMRIVNASETDYDGLSNVERSCFFAITAGSNAYQMIDLRNFSILIDLGQATFNLSAVVGFENLSEDSEVVILMHFAQIDSSFDYKASMRGPTVHGFSFQEFTFQRKIPLKTRYLLLSIVCQAANSTDQLCLLNQVTLNIYRIAREITGRYNHGWS